MNGDGGEMRNGNFGEIPALTVMSGGILGEHGICPPTDCVLPWLCHQEEALYEHPFEVMDSFENLLKVINALSSPNKYTHTAHIHSDVTDTFNWLPYLPMSIPRGSWVV